MLLLFVLMLLLLMRVPVVECMQRCCPRCVCQIGPKPCILQSHLTAGTMSHSSHLPYSARRRSNFDRYGDETRRGGEELARSYNLYLVHQPCQVRGPLGGFR